MPHSRIFFLLTVLLWASGTASVSLAANKIIVLTANDNISYTKEANKGFLSGLQQTFTDGKTSYPLSSGYQVELVTYDIGNRKNPLVSYSNDAEVIAIVCLLDEDCAPAIDNLAAKGVLVVAVMASSSVFKGQKNILRLAPSAALEGKAIYAQLKRDKNQRFVVIYESNILSMDLYTAILSEYFVDVTKGNTDKPTFAGAFPISDFLGLSATQRGTTAATIVQLLPKLSLDAIVFAGYDSAFKALTDPAKGGSAALVKNFYSSDFIYPLQRDTAEHSLTAFSGLQVMSLYKPSDQTSLYDSYYYALDAGTFLNTVITSYATTVGSTPTRDKFLEIAQKTTVPVEFSKTGAKSFSEADNFGHFGLHAYSATPDNPAVLQEVSSETAVSGY
jgi:hypothetical protein